MTSTSPVARTHRPIVVVIGVIAAVIVWVILKPVADIKLDVKMSGKTQAVNVVAVIIASLVAGLAAWLVVTLLDKRGGSPRRTWIIVGVVVFLVSLIGPLSVATTSTAKIALACLHLVVALTLIPGLARTIAARR